MSKRDIPLSQALDEWERKMLALVEQRNKPPPKPAEIVPGPWPRPKLTEAELLAKQQQIDYWWERHLSEQARRSAEPSPDQKLTDWIWGRDR
jgi:hypothetical protein